MKKPSPLFKTLSLVAFVLALLGSNGCTKTDASGCRYVLFGGSNSGCSYGYVPVTSTSCCPSYQPYYCSNTNLCYATCSGASCNIPVKGN